MWVLAAFGLLMAGAGLIYCVQNLFQLWAPKAQIWGTAGWLLAFSTVSGGFAFSLWQHWPGIGCSPCLLA